MMDLIFHFACNVWNCAGWWTPNSLTSTDFVAKVELSEVKYWIKFKSVDAIVLTCTMVYTNTTLQKRSWNWKLNKVVCDRSRSPLNQVCWNNHSKCVRLQHKIWIRSQHQYHRQSQFVLIPSVKLSEEKQPRTSWGTYSSSRCRDSSSRCREQHHKKLQTGYYILISAHILSLKIATSKRFSILSSI